MRDLRPLLAPTSIAIVGASSRPHTVASRPLTNLQQVGYRGDIYLINIDGSHQTRITHQ